LLIVDGAVMISKPMILVKQCLALLRLPAGAAAFAVLFLSSADSFADKVVLRIRVENPLPKTVTKDLRVNLPTGIGTNEIINLNGMDLGYDVKKDLYYVKKNLELKPKGTPESFYEFNVEFKDIWVLPDTRLAELKKHAESLLEMLKGRETEKTAEELKTEITRLIESIKKVQDDNSIKAGVKTIQHIKSYDANLAEMDNVVKHLGRLENLVLATGQDPGRLEGDPRTAPKPRHDLEMKPEDYKTVVIKITVRNVSSDKRKFDIRRDLPPEIKANDILEPDGLDVRTDINAGICYVYGEKVEIDAGGTKVYNVKVRDKWNVNFPRFPYLRASASNVLERVKSMEKFKSVEKMLEGVITEIEQLEKEPVPTELSDRYVAFFKEQAKKLDLIEQKISRIEATMKPRTSQVGFDAKPPNPKTTWMIIWIILGFLLFLSLVFFFRWYGKTKAEKLTDENT